MKERGSALLTAVVIVMVLLSISGVFFTTVIYQTKNESSEEKALRAYYLAESGLSFGAAEVLKDPSKYFLTEPYLHQFAGPVSPWPSGYGGVFDVTIETDTVLPNTFTLNSIGYYPDRNGVRRKLQAQYTIPQNSP